MSSPQISEVEKFKSVRFTNSINSDKQDTNCCIQNFKREREREGERERERERIQTLQSVTFLSDIT